MNTMNEIFVYPEDFIFPEDRSCTTGHSTAELSSMEPQHHDPNTLLLPEEPPLVPPSLFSSESEAGIEFRSSFLFQSSCYLPDDDFSQSDCSPVGRGPSETSLEEAEPNQPEETHKQTESVSSDDNAAMRSKRFERRRTKTWKDPRHHHIEFRNDVSVSDVTRKIDPSWRGYKIYVPGQGHNNAMGPNSDERDNYTVTAAHTRAGMSTLSYEADFFTFVFPQTRKHQWACATLMMALVAVSAVLGVTCGIGLCDVSRDKPAAQPEAGPNPATDSNLGISPSAVDAVPTSTPMLLISTAMPRAGSKPFLSTEELYRAVDEYLVNGGEDSLVAFDYGYPIRTWDVRHLTNLSQVFDARRNPLAAEFNEDLDAWDTSNVTAMENTFFGAKAFNANISSWDTSRVTTMKQFLAWATSFNRDLSQWDVGRVETMEGMFEYAESFNTNLLDWNTESLTIMTRMFANCILFEGTGLEAWDASNVESLMYTFENTPRFKGDLSSWVVGRVVTLKGAFRRSISFNSDLSNWDVSSVTDMSEMFMHATMFNSEISAWNSSFVNDLSCAFFGASSFNADISQWDVRNVVNFTRMVSGATPFNQDLCSWGQNVPYAKDVTTTSMFLSTGCPNTADPDIKRWSTSSFCYSCATPSTSAPSPLVASLDEQTMPPTYDENKEIPDDVFSPRTEFLYIADGDELRNAVDKYLVDPSQTSHVAEVYGYPMATWNVSRVADFNSVFDAERNNMTILFNEDLNGWDTSSAVTMERTFAGASSFNGNVSTWSTARVENMRAMFSGADRFNGDLSSWDVGLVQDMESMFQFSLSFTGQGLVNWNTSSATNMKALFKDASSFSSDLSTWTVGNVVDMTEIFSFAISFNSNLDLWDVSKVQSFHYAFHGAGSFNRDLSSWNVASAVALEGMFSGAKGFNQNLCDWGPRLDRSHEIDLIGMFVASGCLVTESPDPRDPTIGPFCRLCDDP